MYPVVGKKKCRISLKYGVRYGFDFPIKRLRGKKHRGVDITPKYGYKRQTFYLKAANKGKIIFAKWHNGYGFKIKIQDPDNVVHIYAHCAKIFVKQDQYVSKGQSIGILGNTGWSTGAHLHYQVMHKVKGKWRDFSPMKYLT